MSRSNWGIYAAIGIAAIAGIGTSTIIYREADALQSRYEHQAEKPAQAARDGARVHIERACVAVPQDERAMCADEQYHAAREREREEYDLQAQLVTSAWTRAMGLAALIAMFIGIVGIGLIYATFEQTRRAANAAHDANRAWLVIKNLTIKELSFFGEPSDDPQIWVICDFEVENVGRAPALDVAIIQWGQFTVHGEATAFFDGTANAIGNFAIAPQQAFPRPPGAAIGISVPTTADDSPAHIQISVSITYRSASDPTIHQTANSYMIGRFQGAMRIFSLGEIKQRIVVADTLPFGKARMT